MRPMWHRFRTSRPKRAQLDVSRSGPIIQETFAKYSEYAQTQVQANLEGLNLQCVDRDNIVAWSAALRQHLGYSPRAGLCHGVRTGREQAWFSEILNCTVLGTDISPSASDFDNTVRWDFHEEREEWNGAFDFVYSNSLDHAYDPTKAIRVWLKQLREGGLLLVELSEMHRPEWSTKVDPFGIDLEYFPWFILKETANSAYVEAAVPAPSSASLDQWGVNGDIVLFVVRRLADSLA
jgi:SAM-dependent methyltransferase